MACDVLSLDRLCLLPELYGDLWVAGVVCLWWLRI